MVGNGVHNGDSTVYMLHQFMVSMLTSHKLVVLMTPLSRVGYRVQHVKLLQQARGNAGIQYR